MFDCTMINNELDLLELRFNILYPYVEKFVIVESDRTHSGKPKELHFQNNKSRFEPFLSKVIHLQYHGHEVSSGGEAWGNEAGQRNTILEALNVATPEDNLFCVSDVDEIPNPEKLAVAKEILIQTGMPVALNMHYSMYYMNLLSNTLYRGAYLYNPSIAKEVHERFGQSDYSPTYFRWHVAAPGYENDFPVVNEAGWHFSTMGGITAIREKLASYAHVEFNTPEVTSEEHLVKCIATGTQYFEGLFQFQSNDAKFFRTDISFLPEYVRNNLDKYRKYIL